MRWTTNKFLMWFFIIWSSLIISGINASQLFAQIPEDKIDFKAIDTYIVEKMRVPRIPGLAVAIVKDDQIVYLK